MSIVGAGFNRIDAGTRLNGEVVFISSSLDCLPWDEILHVEQNGEGNWDHYTLAVMEMTREWIAGEREAALLWNAIHTLQEEMLDE